MSAAGNHPPLPGTELRPSGSLVERALAQLVDGPVKTEALAAEVLALRGNPRAAAAAVYALLGSDARVSVDSFGVWSLAERPETTAVEPLCEQEWVVVDIETTGGSAARGHRVIEIAAVHVARGEIRSEFSSLVNPGRPIPRMITSLTGIANDMVSDAPRFDEIATRFADVLGGRVFVGHNAAFDWGFVSAEMERSLGQRLDGRRFCTLRVARRLLPHLRSRSLGSLAEHFGIPMEVHHRALDDAIATARLLLRFLDDLEGEGVADWASLENFFQRRRPRRRRTAMPAPMERA